MAIIFALLSIAYGLMNIFGKDKFTEIELMSYDIQGSIFFVGFVILLAIRELKND